jgi:hypothetical protein
MSSAADDEIAALRAAAAKAREEAAKLERELGKEATTKTIQARNSISEEEIISKVALIDFGQGDAMSQTMMLDELVSSGDLSFWKSVQKDQMLRTFPVSQQFLDSRTGGKVNGQALGLSGEGEVSLDDFKYAALGVTGACSVLGVAALAFLPENIGATVCYLVAVIPVLFLGIGSSAPGLIGGAIAKAKGSADDNQQRFDRICRHEAAHCFAGYACGLPVKSYSIMDNGVPCVEFHPSSAGDATSREYSPEEVATLAVVAMSGSVGEILEFGNAKGGENDLIELERVFTRSKEFLGAQKQQDLTRWGALTAFQLLSKNIEKYEKLVGAFKSKKSVAECIAVMETR